MSLSVTLNDISYTIPEEQETGFGLTLTTYLADLAEYLQNGYLANVGQRIKLNTNATSGTINNLNTNNQSFIRLTGANVITGIGNVQIGKFVHLINASSVDIEIPNEDSGSDLNNQILTTDGNSFYLVPNGIASFYYDSSETKWRLINSSSLVNEKYVVDSTSGVIENLNTTNRTFIRLTEATEVNTLASPLSGKRILLLNDTGETITLKHDTGTTVANRIYVSNGYDFILEDKNYTQLIYNPNSSRWEIIGKDSITRDNISIITTVGAIHNLDIAKLSAIKLTQATELTGFNSNEEGREIIVFNDNATPLIIKNQSLDSITTNRIITDTNADVSIRQYGTVIFKYDSDSERWKIQSRTIDDSGYDSKYERLVNKGANNGYASLGAGGKVPTSQIDLGFTNLNDTPNSFTGQKSKVVKVKTDETGLEFGNTTDSANYIEFPTAIDDPTDLGWSLYYDGLDIPVDGLGGTLPGNVTWTQNTTDPLSGIGDFLFDFDGTAGFAGEGASIGFTIDKRHLGKVLQFEFDVCLRSGSYPIPYLGVFIIADPTGTPQVIVPDNSNINLQLIGSSYKFIGNFQTLINETEYRFCINKILGGPPFSVSFNNFKIWEQEKSYGSIISEWQSYTATLTNMGTSPTQALFWRRNGQNLEIKGRITTGSGVPASVGSFSTPNGYVFDSSICATRQAVGVLVRASGSINQCNILALAPESVFYFSGGDGSAVNTGLTPQNTNAILDSSAIHSVNLSVPIQGWGGTVQLSSQVGDGRSVYCLYRNPSAGGTSSTDPIRYTDFQYDSHGAYNTSTGRFTAPISGWYDVKASLIATITQVDIHLRKNGSKYLTLGITNNSGGSISARSHGSGSLFLQAGEYIDIVPDSAMTLAGNSFYGFSVESSTAGSQTFAREEFVGASYYLSANSTTSAQINFSAKLYDTHGAVTTGASWKFTAPQTGKYLITGFLSTSGNYRVLLYKNNSAYIYSLGVTPASASVTTISYAIDLLSGDYIDIRPDSSSTWSGGTLSSAYASRIEITKVS